MKRIFYLVSLLFVVFNTSAQSKNRTQLSGKIIDAKTGEPLAGASITIADSRVGTFADSAGNYKLKNLPVGHTMIEVTYAGYKTLVEHLDLHDTTEHNFSLMSSMLVNEGVTVTAVANATSIRKAPIPISRVNKNELLQEASTNIIDALSRQPGISQLSTGPAISKPIIRGLGYNRLVVINDGVRQEGQQWGDEHGIEIDENSVSRVEIVKGPASLIYGSDAIAGVINIITTVPVLVNTVRGAILSSYQTNNKQRSFFGTIGGNKNGFNWNTWGDYKAAADYRNKYDDRVFNSKFNEHNFGGYAGINKSWGFTHFIVSSFNQKLGVIEGERNVDGNFIKQLPGRLQGTPTDTDFSNTNPQVPYQHVRHLKFISDNSFKAGAGKITLTLGWQRNQRQEFGNPDEPKLNDLYFDLMTFNYSVMYHLNEKNNWITSVGLTGMKQNNKNKASEVLIPEYDLFDIGSFLYTQKTIGKTTVSGGIRYDHRDLNSKQLKDGADVRFQGFKRNFGNFSSSAGISYSPTENFVLKFNLANGFRAPSIPELASNGAHEGTNRYEYGEQNLKSEKSYQADFGFEVNSDHLLVTANAFYNKVNNFIFYSKLPGANSTDSLVDVNGDLIPAFQFEQHNAHLAGAEFLIDLHPHPFDWLHWQNTVSYVRGKFSDEIAGIKDMPFIPATRWISEFRTELLPTGKSIKNLSINFEIDHTFNQNHPFTSYATETVSQGYSLLNVGLSGNIVSKNKTLFSLYFNALNITDVAYQNHLSRLKYTDVNPVTGRQGVFNVGRNFSIKLNIPLSFETKEP
jgi:iron complex outermembrane receptor protein